MSDLEVGRGKPALRMIKESMRMWELVEGAHRLIVLDVESRLDPCISKIADHGPLVKNVELHRRAALHTLVAVAIITADVRDDGSFSSVTLNASGSSDNPEPEVLAAIEEALDAPTEPAWIITYGGSLHDLPLIRQRAVANWMFESSGIRRLDTAPHIDLMTDGLSPGARWKSLRDECAALSIPLREQMMDPTGYADRPFRKCQVDVVTSFLLHLHRQSYVRRSPLYLASGWAALAVHLAEDWPAATYLRPYFQNAKLSIARSYLEGR